VISATSSFAANPLEEAQGFKALLNLEDPKYGGTWNSGLSITFF
jgi:hypothetical protein